MHPFQLIVNSRRRLQNILQGSLGINQETAVGAAWLNSAAGADVRIATDWEFLSLDSGSQGSPSFESSIRSQGRCSPFGADQTPRRDALASASMVS